jgi:mevalonate kinase
MPAISASAPGKIILFGEHAVVYGQPAIAIPIHQVSARAVVSALPTSPKGEVLIDAPDIQLLDTNKNLSPQNPIVVILNLLQSHLEIDSFPAMRLRIHSTIPIAGGMGSGAAIAVAILRAVSNFINRQMDDEIINQLAFESEKTFHGTPSGVDNTVITYAQPIFFKHGQPFVRMFPACGLTFVIADSGQSSSTAEMVTGVRQRWQQNPDMVGSIFDRIGEITIRARQLIESNSPQGLGELMINNHQLLQLIGVSTPKLDYLVGEALFAGATGAKLSGAGGGGNIIALTDQSNAQDVANRLSKAGAARTIITHLTPENH